MTAFNQRYAQAADDEQREALREEYYAFIDKAIDFGFSIPDQISIVAANAENYSEYLYVPLTCSQIPISTIARMAAKMLIDIINDKTVEKIDKLSCEIVDGKSVKKFEP